MRRTFQAGGKCAQFLTMNIDGDDENVYPYVNPIDRLRFDVSSSMKEFTNIHGTRKKGMFCTKLEHCDEENTNKEEQQKQYQLV